MVSCSYDDTLKVWAPDVDGDDWHCAQTISRETVGEARGGRACCPLRAPLIWQRGTASPESVSCVCAGGAHFDRVGSRVRSGGCGSRGNALLCLKRTGPAPYPVASSDLQTTKRPRYQPDIPMHVPQGGASRAARMTCPCASGTASGGRTSSPRAQSTWAEATSGQSIRCRGPPTGARVGGCAGGPPVFRIPNAS